METPIHGGGPRAGDRAPRGGDELVERHYAYVYRLAWAILDDAREAEDAAQDALLAAVKALEQYRGDAAFTTWLYRITVNVCRAHLRKRRVWRLLGGLWAAETALAEPAALPETLAIQSETDRGLWATVAALDEKHRLPLILRYVHGLPTPEIAQVLGLREGTVRSRLHYARQRLRQRLTRSGVLSREVPEVSP